MTSSKQDPADKITMIDTGAAPGAAPLLSTEPAQLKARIDSCHAQPASASESTAKKAH
jgi:hypothetical protein